METEQKQFEEAINDKEFWSESIAEVTKYYHRNINEWYNNYLLYSPEKAVKPSLKLRINWFIFKWKLRIGYAWDALQGKDNWD